MEFNDDIKEELLKAGGGSRRLFWWNVALVTAGLAIVIIIFAGLSARKRSGRPPIESGKPVAPAAQPAVADAASLTQARARQPATRESGTPAPAATVQSQAIIDAAHELRVAGDLHKARDKCYELLAQPADEQSINAAEDMLGAINIELVFKPAPMPEKSDYLVQAGDSLAKIARKFGTTVDLIKKGNQLRGDVIRVGDRMRVFSVPMTVHISKKKNDLAVSADGRFFKRYRVGTGKHGSTPEGIFEINDKITEPPWWRPDGKVVPFGDKENVLGTRWMSLKPIENTDPVRGYGIHGTWEPETIGQQSSAGCVRMFNEEVEELYMLLPLGTKVVIEE